jgi:hypothetical protein
LSNALEGLDLELGNEIMVAAMETVAPSWSSNHVILWNDLPERTFDEVLVALKLAEHIAKTAE